MPDVALTLAPTYGVHLQLGGEGGAVSVVPPSDPLVLQLAPVLRGEPGRSASRGVADQASGATVTIDLSLEKRVYPVLLDQNCVISVSGASTDVGGNPIFVLIEQGAAGGWSAMFDGGFLFPSTVPSLTLSETPGSIDMVGFVYVHGLGCLFVGVVQGF